MKKARAGGYLILLIPVMTFSNSAFADLGAFKIECTQEYFGETVRTVFERSTEFEDKYFGMGIGPRKENPVAYQLLSAEIKNELDGQPFAEHLVVHFESIVHDWDPDQDSMTMYKLTFFKGEEAIGLVSATVSIDRSLLLSARNSFYDDSNFRNCVSVGLW